MKPSILIVEDSEIIGFALCQYFLADGFEVRFVSDPSLAREKPREESAVVLTDLRLGTAETGEGIEFIRSVRALHPHSVLVLLSAYSTPESERLALAAGADAVLPKSLSLTAVTAAVKDLLSKRADARNAIRS